MTEINYNSLIKKYKYLIKESTTDKIALSDLIDRLKDYSTVWNYYYDQIKDLYNISWNYLKRTKYKTESGICPLPIQLKVAKFISHIYVILKLKEPFPEQQNFPGKIGDVHLGDFNITIQLNDETIISTVLWLPANVTTIVECKDPIPNTNIKIGFHYSSDEKSGPLKRWLSLITYYPILSVTSIYNPFGGIVYIDSDVGTGSIDLTFHNVYQHPMADINDPSIWEKTKNIDVPFGEINAGKIIFMIPTSFMQKIKFFQLIYDKYKIIIVRLECNRKMWVSQNNIFRQIPR